MSTVLAGSILAPFPEGIPRSELTRPKDMPVFVFQVRKDVFRFNGTLLRFGFCHH